MSPLRINVWSSPRNISTAFMYSFAQREDTTVVDEPLYAHYLSKTNSETNHPARVEILESMENDGEKVLEKVLFGDYETPIVLFKQMTHHLIDLDLDFLCETDNMLLIRNPAEIIASYSKVIPRPGMEDVGIRMQYDLYHFLESKGKVAAVIDAKELLLDPAKVLKQLCARLRIDFDKKMLTWKPGARPEDGVWAKYWYANVHRSTGFKKYEKREINLSGDLAQLSAKCQPYYDFLYEKSLKA